MERRRDRWWSQSTMDSRGINNVDKKEIGKTGTDDKLIGDRGNRSGRKWTRDLFRPIKIWWLIWELFVKKASVFTFRMYMVVLEADSMFGKASYSYLDLYPKLSICDEIRPLLHNLVIHNTFLLHCLSVFHYRDFFHNQPLLTMTVIYFFRSSQMFFGRFPLLSTDFDAGFSFPCRPNDSCARS